MKLSDVPVVMRPKESLKPPRQQRIHDDETKLRLLAANLEANGFFNPIEALVSGEIISGHRRWKAAMISQVITEVPVRIITDGLTARDIRIRRVSENLQRADLSLWDKYLECRGFKDDEPEVTAKEIAALIDMDNSTVTRYLCLDHCVPAVREAAKEKRIGLKAVYEISKAAQGEQEALLTEALAGGAGQVAKARKKAAGSPSPTEPSGKVVNLKITLPNGKAVITKGENTLAQVAELLKQALAEVEDARKQHLEPKTFAAAMRDRAKAKPKSAPKPLSESA